MKAPWTCKWLKKLILLSTETLLKQTNDMYLLSDSIQDPKWKSSTNVEWSIIVYAINQIESKSKFNTFDIYEAPVSNEYTDVTCIQSHTYVNWSNVVDNCHRIQNQLVDFAYLDI